MRRETEVTKPATPSSFKSISKKQEFSKEPSELNERLSKGRVSGRQTGKMQTQYPLSKMPESRSVVDIDFCHLLEYTNMHMHNEKFGA